MSTTMAKDRPILFSSPMVLAILEGRKTQTRRIIKPPPGEHPNDDGHVLYQCPYGHPGDRLWVRETWTAEKIGKEVLVAYRASCRGDEFDFVQKDGSVSRAVVKRWKPSIFMPREVSRITLEITDVRVQRLQELTEEDAKAEGARFWPEIPDPNPYKQGARWSVASEAPESTDHCLGTARFAFGNLWNKLNEKRGYGWETNPWVWAITFRKVAK
jgi:hypothetical protein